MLIFDEPTSGPQLQISRLEESLEMTESGLDRTLRRQRRSLDNDSEINCDEDRSSKSGKSLRKIQLAMLQQILDLLFYGDE